MHKKNLILLGIIVISLLVATLLPPIPQSLSYHDFADKRLLLNIPNAMDVISNIIFLLSGTTGLCYLSTKDSAKQFIHAWEKLPYAVLFFSISAVSIGSAYYHLDPNNQTLLWDRLPMALAFAAFFVAIFAERINVKIGLILLLPLLLLAAASVFYWHYSEQTGYGDLRFYVLVQFLSVIGALYILLFYPPTYLNTIYTLYIYIWFCLGKVSEFLDKPIFNLTNNIISGHTLKHVFMGIAIFAILRYLKQRTINPLSI